MNSASKYLIVIVYDPVAFNYYAATCYCCRGRGHINRHSGC